MKPSAVHKPFLDYVLNMVLRIGLFIAISIVLCGGAIFLWKHGSEIVDYRIFDGVPASLKGPVNIFNAALPDRLLAVIQLGIMLLIATPVVRVVTCLVVFAAERDVLYVVLSFFVLAVLLFANLEA